MGPFPTGPLTFYSIIVLGMFVFVLGGIFVVNGYASEFIGGVTVAGLITAFAGSALLHHDGNKICP